MIKFVLIGLSPYNCSANDKEPPVVRKLEENVLEDYVKLCLDNGAKPVCVVLPVKEFLRTSYKFSVLKLFRNTVNQIMKKYETAFVDLLDVNIPDNLFQDKLYLNAEGKAAVTALLGERLYFKDIVSPKEVCVADKDFFNVLSKYFSNDYASLIRYVFCKLSCDDFRSLSKTFPRKICINLMARVFSDTTYSHLSTLSDMLPKDDYNDLAARLFKISAEKIRRKDKIKVGFMLRTAAEWCGNKLYDLFARDKNFEPTIFLCAREDFLKEKTLMKDFRHGYEQLKSHKLNVVAIDDLEAVVSMSDILFILTPYLERVPHAFRPANITLETLFVHVTYGLNSFIHPVNYWNRIIFRTSWRIFLATFAELDALKKICVIGAPNGIYSGYPRMDIFFDRERNLNFDWKMAQPDAKKIIWAPHWSIRDGISTFHWNYQLMYEFAKAHPEVSWVVKPHPSLLSSAIKEKVFVSADDLEEYFKKWDELPNAQVYTGTYYQDIFATSDGMILDCGSFVAEYQYVDKPMIYMTRNNWRRDSVGEAILKASYTVDGQDLNAIAEMIQRVFIDGDDYKAQERREVFDKYLNYPKTNGMLASEFIYKNICDELKLPPR